MAMSIAKNPHGTLKRTLTIMLVGCLVNGPTTRAVVPNDPNVRTPVGGLAVISDPAGARVYVDGQLAGRTPLTLDALPAGTHRVRLDKDGYLENGRLVAIDAGTTTRVSVRLTAASGVTSQAGAPAPPPSSGGGGAKWLLLGAAIGAGGLATYLLLTKNQAPVSGTATAAPAIAILGRTVTFNVTGATDPDGDTLTYTWNFGDNSATATGASATHVFTGTGSFQVVVTVSDGKKSATASTSVTIKSLTGIWNGPLQGCTPACNSVVVLTQSGTSFTGTYSDQFPADAGTIAGTVSATGAFTFVVTIPGVLLTFTGDFSADANTMTGTGTAAGFFVNAPWTLVRQ